MRRVYNIIIKLLKTSCKILKITRELLFNIIFIILLLLIIGIIYLYKTDNKIEKKYFGALYVNLQGIIVDKLSNPVSFKKISNEIINNTNNYGQENSLFDIVKAIRSASIDKNITGMILHLDNFISGDQTSLEYIGKAINEFKKTNKPIFAIGSNYTQAQYYLASFANKIYLSPHGSVDLHGFSINKIYYKSFLEKLKINSHVFRVGTYKSAVEPLIRNNMSKKVRQLNQKLLNTSWDNFLNDLSSNRKITKEQIFPNVNVFLNRLRKVKGNNAQYALNQKLVDNIYTNKEIENILNNKFGFDKKTKNFNSINIYNYLDNIENTNNIKDKCNIAVIIVQGDIIDKQQTFKSSIGDKIISQIKEARLNDNIKAIILRINSPGGSVETSELIKDELESVRLSGKPIVVSMGGVAASGGYLISTPANYIIANKNTLTGSIGIFSIINTFEEFLKSIGIYNDGVTISPLGETFSTKKINNFLSEKINITIKNGYEKFVKTVANSRHKTFEEIDNLAQGKIWIGEDAFKNGLIDMLGDFDDAVNKAVKLANLDNAVLDWYNQKLSFTDQILLELSQNILSNLFKIFSQYFYTINNLQQNNFFLISNNLEKKYLYCLNNININ